MRAEGLLSTRWPLSPRACQQASTAQHLRSPCCFLYLPARRTSHLQPLRRMLTRHRHRRRQVARPRLARPRPLASRPLPSRSTCLRPRRCAGTAPRCAPAAPPTLGHASVSLPSPAACQQPVHAQRAPLPHAQRDWGRHALPCLLCYAAPLQEDEERLALEARLALMVPTTAWLSPLPNDATSGALS